MWFSGAKAALQGCVAALQGALDGEALPIMPPVPRADPRLRHSVGTPDPRWWRLEEKDAYFDAPRETEPNALSTLLPEVFYLDIDNWYLIPAPMPAGSIREVTSLKVTDSFGVAIEVQPVNDEDWCVFALDAADGGKDQLGANALFAPNISLDVLDNEVLEDVRFTRDEQANLVWAWEQRDIPDGETIVNGDSFDGPISAKLNSGYIFMSDVPPNWIPYVARQTERSPTDGEIHLKQSAFTLNQSPAEFGCFNINALRSKMRPHRPGR